MKDAIAAIVKDFVVISLSAIDADPKEITKIKRQSIIFIKIRLFLNAMNFI